MEMLAYSQYMQSILDLMKYCTWKLVIYLHVAYCTPAKTNSNRNCNHKWFHVRCLEIYFFISFWEKFSSYFLSMQNTSLGFQHTMHFVSWKRLYIYIYLILFYFDMQVSFLEKQVKKKRWVTERYVCYNWILRQILNTGNWERGIARFFAGNCEKCMIVFVLMVHFLDLIIYMPAFYQLIINTLYLFLQGKTFRWILWMFILRVQCKCFLICFC